MVSRFVEPAILISFWLVWLGLATSLLLAAYLDMRRYTLIGAGQLAASTPACFRTPPTTMGKVFNGLVEPNLAYIFSQAFAEHPDPATRWWAPVLRAMIRATVGAMVLLAGCIILHFALPTS